MSFKSILVANRGEIAVRIIRAANPDGSIGLPAPMQGTIIQIAVCVGDAIHVGQEIIIMEAMKMEHAIKAERSGIVRQINVAEGDIIVEGHPLIFIEEADVGEGEIQATEEIDLDYIRPDLEETYSRHAYTLDENRPEAVAKRHARGFRMPRENIDQLVDPGTFKEY